MPNILFICLKTHQRQPRRRGDIDNPMSTHRSSELGADWLIFCVLKSRCNHSHLILSLITRWLAILAFSSYRGIVGHITTMMDYAQIHIFDACGHYKGRLLLILILHNVMHDITSTLPVDVAPSARFTQNGRPMSIAGGRQE